MKPLRNEIKLLRKEMQYFRDTELAEKRAEMEHRLSVKKLEQKSQIDRLKSELESFKIARDEAIKDQHQNQAI